MSRMFGRGRRDHVIPLSLDEPAATYECHRNITTTRLSVSHGHRTHQDTTASPQYVPQTPQHPPPHHPSIKAAHRRTKQSPPRN